MYGQRDEPYLVLSQLGQRLEATMVPETVLPTIVETVARALKLPYAAIALHHDGTLEAVASTGLPVPDPLRLALVYQHETVGALQVAPRSPTETFNPADRALLEDIARQASAAAYAVRLTVQLQRSREQLVTTREEERRRLRRDLHDGLGPALASMTLQAEAARDLVDREPRRAADLLAALTEQLQASTVDIRRLVYNLRPHALDDLGLRGALQAYLHVPSPPGCGSHSTSRTGSPRYRPPPRSPPSASRRKPSRTSSATLTRGAARCSCGSTTPR